MEDFELKCASFANPVNLYLVFAGVAGIVLNIFPLYVILKLQKTAKRVGRDILTVGLCLVDILTILVPLSINLGVKARCEVAIVASNRPWICEMFFLMFIWLKLSAMFLITVLNYSSYLGLNVKGQYSDRPSIGDRLSNSFYRAKSRGKRTDEHGRSVVVIANLVIGVALVAFVISSLPYLGLGPEGKSAYFNSSSTQTWPNTRPQLCHLEQISFPLKGKEYTFLFAVLMSSAACLIIHLVHSVLSCFSCCFWRENLREAQELDIQMVSRNSNVAGGLHLVQSVQEITDSHARMTFALGVAFFATWIPLMFAMGSVMSSGSLRNDVKEYCIAGTFSNQLADPLIYAIFIAEYRRGYIHLLRKIFDFINYLPGVFIASKTKAVLQITQSSNN